MTKPIRLFWGYGETRHYPCDFYNADEMDEYLAAYMGHRDNLADLQNDVIARRDRHIEKLLAELEQLGEEAQRRTVQLDQLAADVKDGRVLAEFKQHQIDRLRKVIEDLDFGAEGRLQGVVDFQALRIAWFKRSLKDRDAAIAELSADLI